MIIKLENKFHFGIISQEMVMYAAYSMLHTEKSRDRLADAS